MKKVFIKSDDIDRHGIGCPCDLCDQNGKSYGVGLYDVSDWTMMPGDNVPEDLLDELNFSECFYRFYAASEEVALKKARADVRENGWILYE